MNPVTIKKIGDSDIITLLNISRELFFAAFAHLNHPADMDIYADTNFTIDKLTAEMHTPGSHFYFAYQESNIAGYLKINYHNAQTEFRDSKAMEIERIYVNPKFQNQQIGRQLLQFAVDTALKQSLKFIWLGVWDANDRAIRFYERHGFRTFSSHDFMLGNDKQTDLLMKREL